MPFVHENVKACQQHGSPVKVKGWTALAEGADLKKDEHFVKIRGLLHPYECTRGDKNAEAVINKMVEAALGIDEDLFIKFGTT
jgi:hypothetical protein